jgi:hypothetical protein
MDNTYAMDHQECMDHDIHNIITVNHMEINYKNGSLFHPITLHRTPTHQIIVNLDYLRHHIIISSLRVM